MATGPGREAVATELLAWVRAELPAVATMGAREQLLDAAWLASLRSARTRRAYAGDLAGWLSWLGERGTNVLAAGRVHADLWVAAQQAHGAEASTVRRRLSALSSFYRHCAAHDLTGRNPVEGVARPMVDPDYTATIGLDRDQARALLNAADRDTGAQALRTAAAAVRLLLHNALRVNEACGANVADLGADAGHRVLRVTRKGARKAKIPLTPATVAALDNYLSNRVRRARLDSVAELGGPLLATATGGRLRQSHLWELVRRLARAAGIETWGTCRRIRCGIRRSPSLSTPAPPCATFRTTPATRTRAPPAVTTTPATVSTATPLTPWPPTWHSWAQECRLGNPRAAAHEAETLRVSSLTTARLQATFSA